MKELSAMDVLSVVQNKYTLSIETTEQLFHKKIEMTCI